MYKGRKPKEFLDRNQAEGYEKYIQICIQRGRKQSTEMKSILKNKKDWQKRKYKKKKNWTAAQQITQELKIRKDISYRI